MSRAFSQFGRVQIHGKKTGSERQRQNRLLWFRFCLFVCLARVLFSPLKFRMSSIAVVVVVSVFHFSDFRVPTMINGFSTMFHVQINFN